MRCTPFTAALLASFTMGCGAALAQVPPAVDVSFPNVARFSDAGETPRDVERNLAALTQHLQHLGTRWLAPGQHLSVEITELDLAGRVLPSPRLPRLVRVLNGGADWPRIGVRYVLATPAGEIARGEESLDDKNYLVNPLASSADQPLGYERRLLTRWFRDRFDAAVSH